MIQHARSRRAGRSPRSQREIDTRARLTAAQSTSGRWARALYALSFASTLIAAAACGSKEADTSARGGTDAREDEVSSQGHTSDEHDAGPQRVELSPRAIELAGIEVGLVEARTISVTVETSGEVRLNAERVLHVRPRFPGVVKELHKRLGDAVHGGELLAVVQSNESFTDYPIQASMDGTVVSRDVVVGAAVDHESVLYTVADLSSVWVDFAIYPQHMGHIRRGQPVSVSGMANGGPEATGIVAYVGPLLEQDTRLSYARVVLPNPVGAWLPGLFVSVTTTIDRAQVGAAVPEEAIIRTAGGPAVFRVAGGAFVLQPIVTGRTDGDFTEVTQGVSPGDSIVVRNAFIVKAEFGKSAAGHDD